MTHFTLSKILVPIDFSEESTYALDTAIALSHLQKASVTLLHVVDSTTFGTVAQFSAVSEEKLRDFVNTLSSKLISPVSYHVEAGKAGEVICAYASSLKCDLIVLGAKKQFALTRMFREPVTNHVVKNAPCPVLSVPSTRVFRQFKKILFPVRRVSNVLENYEFLRPILNRYASMLYVAGLTRVNNAEDFDEVKSIVEVLRRKLQRDQIPYSSRIHLCDSISDQLLEISSHEKPDLIVITAKVEYWFKQVFLEYYTKVIVSRSQCPVLSIRQG